MAGESLIVNPSNTSDFTVESTKINADYMEMNSTLVTESSQSTGR